MANRTFCKVLSCQDIAPNPEHPGVTNRIKYATLMAWRKPTSIGLVNEHH